MESKELITKKDFLKKLGILGIGGALALITIPKVFSADLLFKDLSNISFGSGTVTGRMRKRCVQSFGSADNLTPTSDTADIYQFSTDAVAGTLTVNNPSGTPNDGQGLLLRILTTNKQTYSWGANFRGGTTALPTSTTGTSKTDYIAFIWTAADSKWDLTGQSGGH